MALVKPEQDTGVEHGDVLLAFAEAVIGTDRKALDDVRAELAGALGDVAVSGVAAVAANFSKNDRVANGIGIPMDPVVFKGTEDLRAEMGLNAYKSAENTFRHM
ncbi:MAG: hypothetical protein JJ899_06595 [Alphaproteobacteria bacterium]|nr:hypothetical protein [Alphaproteobacteria bacterium]